MPPLGRAGLLFEKMEENKRVFIIIDGSNFYHRLHELDLRNLLNFDYKKFSEFLVGSRNLALQRYYIGAIREESNNPKSRVLMKKSTKTAR